MLALLDEVRQWRAAGHRCAIARVVAVEGSAPRGPGAAMVVRADGVVAGSLSGGCVESAAVTDGLEVLERDERRMVTYGISDEEAFGVGLTCGGTLHVFVEPFDW